MVFSISMNIQTVNRVVFNTPKSLFEAAIPLVSEEEKFTPYFDKEKLKHSLTYYYSKNFDKHIKNYVLNFYYYSPHDYAICVDDKCQAVSVEVTVNFAFDFKYQRNVYYEIKEGNYYEP
jgi:hypothetical protein